MREKQKSLARMLVLTLSTLAAPAGVLRAQEPAAPAEANPPAPADVTPAAPTPPPESSAPAPAEAQPTLDRILEDLSKIDPALLAERLAAMQAQIAKLREESEALKAKIAANEAEAQKLGIHALLLEALLKVRGGAPAPPPPAPGQAMAPTQGAVAAAEATAPPPVAGSPAESPAANPPATAPAMTTTDAAPAPNYQDHVYPIFSESCLGCHNPDKAKGGLVLDSFASMMQGGGSGAVIAPGSPDQSRLFRLVAHLEAPEMPPMRSKLSDDKIEVLRRWIAAGAHADAASAQRAADAAASAAPMTEAASASAAPVDQESGPMPAASLADFTVKPIVQPPPAIALAVSPAAPLLAVAGFEQIFMYHLDTGALLGGIDVGDFRVESLSFSDDGAALLAAGGLAGKYGSALLFDVETGRKTTEFDKQYDAVLCADLAPGGTLAAVGGANRKVRVFDGFTAERLFEIADHTDWVQAVAFSPDGLYLATGDRAGGLYLWESDTGRRVHELRGHSGAVSALAFQRDSAALVSVGRDGTMRFWGVEAGNVIRQVAAHGVAALDVASAVNGRWATSGADGRVRIWNADGGEFRSLEPHGDWVYQASFSTDGAKLVAGDWTGAVRIYESETGALLNALSTAPPAPARPVALASPVAAGSGGR